MNTWSKLYLLLPFLFCNLVYAQDNSNAYHFGTGLVVFEGPQYGLLWEKQIPLFKDSMCTSLWFNLAAKDTRCPTCMACAEPIEYHNGNFRPFNCGGGEGVAFICVNVAKNYREVIVDSIGTRAFLNNRTGVYYSWQNYFLKKARKGDYFRIERQWDSAVLYDRPYAINALPAADSHLAVGVKFRDFSYWRFYPVAVKGYWVKLKAMDGKQLKGYCWLIWRNDKEILNWFAWRAE